MIRRPTTRPGFTLIELLVVIAIILLVSVVSLPLVLPTLNQRQVSESALILQAEISRARDQAIRDDAPRGFRLIPDREGRFAFNGPTPAYNRMIAIEPGPDYSEGQLLAVTTANVAGMTPNPNDPARGGYPTFAVNGDPNPRSATSTWLMVAEAKVQPPLIPRNPTSWYWNVRQGDKLVVGNAGRAYTIVGPMLVPNPEGYINYGPAGSPYGTSQPSVVGTDTREFLILLNGSDDDLGGGDGYIDEAFDGINNDNDYYPNTAFFQNLNLAGKPVVDPGFNGIDDDANGAIDEPREVYLHYPMGSTTPVYDLFVSEYEPEPPLPGEIGDTDAAAVPYVIQRRPAPSRNARELTLPGNVVIDMTTWDTTRERSRLPINPRTGFVEIMVAPNGQLVQPIAGRTEPIPPSFPFYHFWLTDIEDVHDPIDLRTNNPPVPYLLPMPASALGYPATGDTSNRVLEANRRLVTLNTRTGQITTTTIENFNIGDLATNPAALDRPFLEAQAGQKESP